MILPLETERLKNPTTTAGNGHPGMGQSLKNAQAACGFKCSASKRTSFFQMINVIAAIFLAKVRRAIVGFFPLANKPS